MFSLIEGWSYGNSVYFCFVSLTTIGLGDFAPETPEGRGYSFFFLLTGTISRKRLVCMIRASLSGLGIITIIIEDSIVLYSGSEDGSEEDVLTMKAELKAKDERIR